MQLRKILIHSHDFEIILLCALIFFTLLIRSIPYLSGESGQITNGIPQGLDSLQQIFVTTKLVETGAFYHGDYIHGNGYWPYVTPTISNYPMTQILLAIQHWIFPDIPIYKLIGPLVILLEGMLPLLVYVIARSVYKNIVLAFFTSFLTATLLATSRDLVWATPHTLQSYILVLSLLFAIWKYIETEKLNWMLFSVLMIISIVHTHLLTFAVIIPPILLFIAVKLKTKKHAMLLVLIIIILYILATALTPMLMGGFGGSNFSVSNFVISILYKFSDPTQPEVSQLHPFWDHPSVWGYSLTILGFLGFFNPMHKKQKDYQQLLIFLFLFIIIMANSHYIGLYLVNFRFVFYGWIPLIFMAPHGYSVLMNQLSNTRMKTYVQLFIISLLFASTIHGITFEISANHVHPEFTGETFPQKDNLDAMLWIKNNTDKNSTILISASRENAYVHWTPIISDRKVTYGWTINKPTPPQVKFQSFTLIGTAINPFVGSDLKERRNKSTYNGWLRKYQPYLMLSYPDKNESHKLMDDFGIEYIYTWRDSPYDARLSDSKSFKIAFTQGDARIYERIH